MKTLTNFFKLALITAIAAVLLVACKSMPLEEQILEGLNEPGTYTFKYELEGDIPKYIRIYDQPNKQGIVNFEHGQKHPCSQGFRKAIKSTAPGMVQYMVDVDAKAFACPMTHRYIFRVDANGLPYEGWANFIVDKSGKKFDELSRWRTHSKPVHLKIVK